MSDTLASLQTALAPKTGLHPIPLASQSYELQTTASSEQAVNFFAERLPPGGRSPFILKPTPGLTFYDSFGTGPILAIAALTTPVLGSHLRTGQYWVISGTNAYVREEPVSGPPTLLGGIGTPAAGIKPADYNSVSIAMGLGHVLFCVPPEVFVLDKLTFSFVQLVAGVNNYPAIGASSVAFLDGYYIFASFTGEQVFVSNLLDPTHFTALAFAQISAYGDYVDFLFVHNSQLWLFGQIACQPWYDTGDPTFPFAPVPGSMVMHGLGAPRSIVEIDNALVFLSNDGCVYAIRGYQAAKISSPALEEALTRYNGGYLRAITACGFSYEGHAFYSMQLLVTGFTWVYDFNTQLWHQRSTANSSWLVGCTAQLDAHVLCGSRSDARIYHMDSSTALENSIPMARTAALPALVGHGPRTFMNRVEIEMSTGVDGGTVSLDWSDDGGVNYRTPARVLSTGAPGATKTRVATTRLGSFRIRNLRLKTTAGAPTIYSIDADIPPRQG